MDENKDIRQEQPPQGAEEIAQSNVARRIQALEKNPYEEKKQEPLKINKWSNFWYHHKAKVIIIAAFTFIIGVAVVQYARQANPDVSMLYAGPDYISPNMNQAFCDIIESIMDDYDGDGEKYAQLNDFVFMSEGQMEAYEQQMEELGEKSAVDRLNNAQTEERFTFEIFGSEASICFLSRDQYEMVHGEQGFLPLSDIFGEEIPEGAIDDCGVLFSETKLYKFYASAQIFPEDTVVALRRLSTMSALTGKDKAERIHQRAADLFEKILTFDYPQGYIPPEETAAE